MLTGSEFSPAEEGLRLRWAAGTLVFAAAYPHHLIPAAPNAPHPAFQPVIYALDVLLPVVDLNQAALRAFSPAFSSLSVMPVVGANPLTVG